MNAIFGAGCLVVSIVAVKISQYLYPGSPLLVLNISDSLEALVPTKKYVFIARRHLLFSASPRSTIDSADDHTRLQLFLPQPDWHVVVLKGFLLDDVSSGMLFMTSTFAVRTTSMHSIRLESGNFVPCWCGVLEGEGDEKVAHHKMHVMVG